MLQLTEENTKFINEDLISDFSKFIDKLLPIFDCKSRPTINCLTFIFLFITISGVYFNVI